VKARVGRSGGYYGVCGFITDAEDAAGGWLDGKTRSRLRSCACLVHAWFILVSMCSWHAAPGPTARDSPHQKPTLSYKQARAACVK
jgi:hypothetical protein